MQIASIIKSKSKRCFFVLDWTRILLMTTCKNFTESLVDDPRPLATYVNVFMVRGLLSRGWGSHGKPWLDRKISNTNKGRIGCCSFCYFAGLWIGSSQLFPIVWQATYVLKPPWFYMRVFVSDCASPNYKFYCIHKDGETLTYKTKNLLKPDRDIYFISDAPRPIETTGNNFSHRQFYTKILIVNYPFFTMFTPVASHTWCDTTSTYMLGIILVFANFKRTAAFKSIALQFHDKHSPSEIRAASIHFFALLYCYANLSTTWCSLLLFVHCRHRHKQKECN